MTRLHQRIKIYFQYYFERFSLLAVFKAIFRRIRIFFWYHIGKKDMIFVDKVPKGHIHSRYMPDVVFTRNATVYNAGYKKEHDNFTVLVGSQRQKHDL